MGGGKVEAVWFCCTCRHFWSSVLYSACTSCHHRRCPYCTLEWTAKSRNPAARRPQGTSRPASSTQQPKPCYPLVRPNQDDSPPKKSNDQAPLGSKTISISAHAAGLPTSKLTGTPSSGEVQGDPDGEGYRRSNNQIIHPTNLPETKSLAPTKTAPTVPPGPETGSIAQRLQIQLRSVEPPTRSITYPPRPAVLSDYDDNDKGPRGAAKSHVPFPELNLAQADKTLTLGKGPSPKSAEQGPNGLHKPTRDNWPAILPAFRRSRNSDPPTHFKTDHVERSPVADYNDSDTVVPLISNLPLVVDVNDIASQELFHLLVQKVYRAFCFDSSGSFRSRGVSRSGQDLTPTTTNDQTPTTNRKRRRQGGCDEAQNKPGDNDRKSSRTKRSRVKPRKLGAFLQEFACLFCKRNIDYGYEARCIGWSNASIDEVLRRHLLIHVDIEPQHLSEAKYERVNQMKSDYNLSDQSQAEELWIAAYMEIFEIDQRNRNTVPNPYLRREDFPLDPNHAVFFSRMIDMVGANPASTSRIISLVRGTEAIARDINHRRQRLREQYYAQEAQYIRDSRAGLEAAERVLDAESDERHLRLYMDFEPDLGLAQWLGQDATHGRQHGSVSTQVPENHNQLHNSDLPAEEQSHVIPWDRASSHILGHLNSSRLDSTTSSMLGPEPRNHQAPVTRLPSMDIDNNSNEAFLDSVERQSLSSTAIGESHADSVSANIVRPYADEEFGVAPVTVRQRGGARNGPNPQFEYGGSHTPCQGCGKILMGQDACDSCAGVFNAEPSSWFNG